ncbi:MAG: hemolysin family protein, partial [bacterium]|nr:hemolysin family protein [bacterium]
MSSEIILIIIACIASALFSGAETVFLTSSKIRLEIMFRRNVKALKRIYSFMDKPESVIVTVLVGNNLSNVAFSTLVIVVFRDSIDELFIVLLSAMFLLLFAEVIPKAIGREFANQLIIRTGQILLIFKYLFYPINLLLSSITNVFLKQINMPQEEKSIHSLFTRKDVIKVLRESERAGVIQSKEGRIIQKIFDLRKTRLKDPMVPRTGMVAVNNDTPVEDLFLIFKQSGYSRIPVYDGTIDNIIGVVYAKDLLTNPAQLVDVLKDVIFVPDTKPVYDLLKEFRGKNASIAIVIDEYG